MSRVPAAPVIVWIWGGVALFFAGWVWELIRFSGLQIEFGDRFFTGLSGLRPEVADKLLILVGSAWLAWQAWPEIASRPARPSPLGVPLVLAGALIYPVGWFVFQQVGPRPILLWWGYMCLLLMIVGALVATRGWYAVRRLAFPLLFAALTPPIPGRINSPLQDALQGVTTTLAFHGLTSLGFEVVREGFVLRLPGGHLGVIEACSGVRSVTSLTAIALFLAHTRNLGIGRGVISLVLAVPVIILVNAIRVIVSGCLQEWFGQSAIMGWRHEALGYGAVFLGLAFVAGITALLRPKSATVAPIVPGPAIPTPWSVWAVAAAAALVLGLALTLAVTFLPGLARSTDGASETIDHLAPTVDSRNPEGDVTRWTGGENIPIPDELSSELTYTHGINRLYKDRLGNKVVVYVFHWTSATGVKGYHHPDICLPSRGFEIASRGVEPVTTPKGRPLPITFRNFIRGREKITVGYWTQEGRRVWTDADETAAFSFQYPFLWVRERLQSRKAGDVDDRLVIWCFAEGWADNAEEKARFLGFVAALADEVYRLCPWAAPIPSATDSAKSR